MELEEVVPTKSMDHTSFSSLKLFRSCPQKWVMRYVLNLQQIDTGAANPNRDLGSWWHALRAADSIDRGRRLGSIKSVPKDIRTVDDAPRISTSAGDDTIQSRVMAAASRYNGRLSNEDKDTWKAKLGDELPDRLTNLDRLWRAENGKSLETEEPIAVELRWERTASTSGKGPKLVGYVDEVYFSRERGMCVVRDHKSMGTLETTSPMNVLDSQLHLYAWGAAPTIESWGYKIRALAYDRIKSTAPKTPQVTKSGTLSKSVTKYDLQTYLDWARGETGDGVPFVGAEADGSKAGMYVAEEAVIEKLDRPETRAMWADRAVSPVNNNVISAHLKAALATYYDQKRTLEKYLKTGWSLCNMTKACQYSEYNELCKAIMYGGANGNYDLEDFGLEVTPGTH